jgi:hypothetical protein
MGRFTAPDAPIGAPSTGGQDDVLGGRCVRAPDGTSGQCNYVEPGP